MWHGVAEQKGLGQTPSACTWQEEAGRALRSRRTVTVLAGLQEAGDAGKDWARSPPWSCRRVCFNLTLFIFSRIQLWNL